MTTSGPAHLVFSIMLAFTAIRFAGPVYFLLVIPKTAVPWIMGVKRQKYEAAIP